MELDLSIKLIVIAGSVLSCGVGFIVSFRLSQIKIAELNEKNKELERNLEADLKKLEYDLLTRLKDHKDETYSNSKAIWDKIDKLGDKFDKVIQAVGEIKGLMSKGD